MAIKLSRELTGRERIDVNYRISGAEADVHYRDKFFRSENDASITRMKRADGSRRVRFTDGAQIATIRLAALNNNDRANRTLTIRLGGGHQRVVARHVSEGVKIAQSEAAVSIVDDDNPQQTFPEITIVGRLPLSEGKPARFWVTATPAPALPLNVLVHFVPDGDFGVAKHDRWVTIPTSGTVNVGVGTVDDSVDEPNGSVTASVFLRDGYTVGKPSSATVKVKDNDKAPAPEVTIAGGNARAEGKPARFTVTASPAPTLPLKVLLHFVPDGDFGVSKHDQWVTIPTSGSAEVKVNTEDDSVDEPNGALTASVFLRDGYEVGTPSSATVKVRDNDDATTPAPALPVVTMTGAAPIVDEFYAQHYGWSIPEIVEGDSIELTLHVTPPPTSPITVAVGIKQRDGLSDFGVRNETRQITVSASGQATFTVTTEDDDVEEDRFDNIQVWLLNSSTYEIATPWSAQVKVLDNDGKHANTVPTHINTGPDTSASNGQPGANLPVVSVGTLYYNSPNVKNNTITESRYHPQNTFRFRVTADPPPEDSIVVNFQLIRLGDYRDDWNSGFGQQMTLRSDSFGSYIAAVRWDDVAEPDGFLAMRILPGEGYVVGESSYVKITILDDD